ncbi:DEAD/DEAH box helicase family protein [Halomonas binhaiensis]|uniref:Helicase C-terminal domain-containing protein n=1 Tax=Halomonas binhaiensis TaxID=2562282 RepID=A0A5C1NG73_9GAMM|nr:DEAD/DEAH box helicase family protein [Halomonas binhaiensis]QEM82692.1 hypothetical protein E4T21_14905 [Halomonas binhaiensis]
MMNRDDPTDIPDVLKEAVALGIVQMLNDRVSGRDEDSSVIFGAAPADVLVSGFLLPPRPQGSRIINDEGDVDGALKAFEDGDPVTRQIHISNHGLDFLVHAKEEGTLVVRPRFSIYLRTIPTRKELDQHDLWPVPRLSGDTRRAIREKLKARKERSPTKEGESQKARHERLLDEVRTEIGLPPLSMEKDMADEAAVSLEEAVNSLVVKAKEDKAVQGKAGDTPSINALFDSIPVPHKWVRIPVRPEPLILNFPSCRSDLDTQLRSHEALIQKTIQEAIQIWIQADPERGRHLYRSRTSILYSELENWDSFIDRVNRVDQPPVLPAHKVSWDITFRSNWENPEQLSTRISLINDSQDPDDKRKLLRANRDWEGTLFDLSLEVELEETLHVPLKMSRIERSYRVNRFLNYPAIGLNGGVRRLRSSPGHIHLGTTWTPQFTQPRMEPVPHAGINRRIRDLAQPGGHIHLQSLREAYAHWIDDVAKNTDLEAMGFSGEELEKEEGALDRDVEEGWKVEMAAVSAGLSILEDSYEAWSARGPQSDAKAAPYEAWLAMNETMANMMQSRTGNDHAQWRLFQIAFILANLPTLVTRMKAFHGLFEEYRDEAVTLLYFSTGGGKSEAFLGLLAFNLLLDRIRGKYFGVTAMLRYPLRLLTIQQANRTARVLAQAELVRKSHQYGGEPFAIGFWVGSGGSPNWRKDVKGVPPLSKGVGPLSDKEASAYEKAKEDWLKIIKCPFCSSTTMLRKTDNGMLAHVCTDAHCETHAGQAYQPLPFYICDEDIYKKAPSVLLGTVDKLALIGQNDSTLKKVFSMFGLAGWLNENGELVAPTRANLEATEKNQGGFTRLKPAFEDGVDLFHDPFPSLLVQDEAHLLNQSLGTFASIFETLFEASLDHLGEVMPHKVVAHYPGTGGTTRRKAKVIAATATVSDPERHMEHLYQRKIPTVQFPHPGPDIYRSFYTQPKVRDTPPADLKPDQEEHASHWSRIYCAILTNGRAHTSATANILGNFHLIITELYEALYSADAGRQEVVRQRLLKSIDPEHPNAKQFRDQLLQETTTPERLLTLVDLHRIALTYVTNKKGGDQVLNAEREETRKCHENKGLSYGGGVTRMITGDVSQGEIQNVIDIAENLPDPHPGLEGLMRSVIATSAVSHGVDVDEFNSMFFAGVPSNIAEYIQASSRVGRTHTGFVLLIPTPQQRRDRYIVEVFDGFHRFLERMVQPAPIDRFARQAMERSFSSIWLNYLGGILPLAKFLDADKQRWRDGSSVNQILREFQGGKAIMNREAFKTYVKEALGINQEFLEESNFEYYRKHFDNLTVELINYLQKAVNEYSDSGDLSMYRYFSEFALVKEEQPMTSLRDVDENGIITQKTQRDKIVATRTLLQVAKHGKA